MTQRTSYQPKDVVIAVRHLPQYRCAFYYGLKQALAEKGVNLRLIYGQPSKQEAVKDDSIDIPWGIRIQNVILELGGRELYWQPIFGHLKGTDLVIVEPGTKFLANFLLILLHNLHYLKVALWGLGENPQKTQALRISEWIKRRLSTKVHWYFAYTDSSARVVGSWGFPRERITIVQNAIDTRPLIEARATLSQAELALLKQTLGIKGEHVALFVGGMTRKRRIKFLLEACGLIRQQVSDFEILMIGAGEDAHLVMEYAGAHPWVHYLGPKFGAAKVPYFALSKLFLMPGVVGLAIVDCLALGVPLVGIRIPDNSHEIDYLINGENGVLIEADASPLRYAEVVSHLLTHDEELRILIHGCEVSAQNYSMEKMVGNFAAGILKALRCPSSI